ncbi:Folate-biopterin transporter, partial [Globisporangium splendens]
MQLQAEKDEWREGEEVGSAMETATLLNAKTHHGDDSGRNVTGALRGGVEQPLLSPKTLGLLAQYAAVGLVYGTLPNTVTPFLTYYLNMEGTATISARALLFVLWSFKAFIGVLSDCVPVGGYRRRPYMALGWSVAALCLLTMACIPIGNPYFPDPELRHVKPGDYTLEQEASLHRQAPNSGGVYIVLMMLTTFGYLFADVASDAVVVEYAQREPLATRGRTQTAVYAVRYLFGIGAQVIAGFGLSSPPYGGGFDFGISSSTTMLTLAVFCVPVVPMTWFFVQETKVQTPDFTEYLRDLWLAIQSKAVYQVIAYLFFSGVCMGISYVAQDPIASYWVRATSFNLSISGLLSGTAMVATLAAMGKYGLHWNWHTVQTIATLSIVVYDALCTYMVTWDTVRSQWFWLGLPIVENIPTGVSMILSSYIGVELAGLGNEAAMYGSLSTISNLSTPVALTLTTRLNAPFKVHNDDILNDTYEVRRDVIITMWLSYALKLASLAFLPWLPRQKSETQALKRNDGANSCLGGLTIAYLLVALFWSISTDLQSVLQQTG